jgi:hypothetical protein
MRIFLIKLIFIACMFLGLLSLTLGIYKFVIRKESFSVVDFVHFPLNSKGILRIKGAHNIVDGIGFILLGLGGYAIFFY